MVEAELQLNPIRFIAHKGREYLSDEDTELDQLLRVNRRVRRTLKSMTFDESDNFLSDNRGSRIAQRANWSEMIAFYTRCVMRLIDQELERCGAGDSGLRLSWENWILRQIESVWEFDEADARRTLEQLRPNLRRRHPQTVVKHWPASSSFEMPLGTNVSLSIYPKSDHRLRVEVRHLKSPRRIYGNRASLSHYPNQTIEQLCQFIEFVHSQSLRRVEYLRLYRCFENWDGQHRFSSMAFTGLITSILERCGGDVRKFRWIFSALLEHGRVSEQPGKEINEECERLVAAGVLVREPTALRERHRTYTFSSQYREMTDQISELFYSP